MKDLHRFVFGNYEGLSPVNLFAFVSVFWILQVPQDTATQFSQS